MFGFFQKSNSTSSSKDTDERPQPNSRALPTARKLSGGPASGTSRSNGDGVARSTSSGNSAAGRRKLSTVQKSSVQDLTSEEESSESDSEEDGKDVSRQTSNLKSLSLSTTATTVSSTSETRSKAKSTPTTPIETNLGPASKGKRQGYESESEEEESSESEEEEEMMDRNQFKAEQEKLKAGQKGGKRLSEAAALAALSMDTPHDARTKLGKSINSLKFEDVAMTEEEMKKDLKVVWKALHLFLNSRMLEAEEICQSGSDHRLYYSLGYSFIQCIKSLATFEPEDLEGAIQCCKESIVISQLLRKKDFGMYENARKLAAGSTSSGSIKGMTIIQRHAELIFAECTLLKAVIGIVYSGDFIASPSTYAQLFAFPPAKVIKEALNMRNAYSIYRTLAKYVEEADATHSSSQRQSGVEDPEIDNDFRSGVFLGNGLISLILSLLPSTVLKLMTVFGFTGDRTYALETLMKAGQWKVGVKEPGMPAHQEGARRQICDMVLLTYHLVFATYLPVGGVDVPTAGNILRYNLDRYPNGIFFLYFSGRLHATETQLETSVVAFHRAIVSQKEYIQLGHICWWDLGLVSLASGDYQKGYECFDLLDKESNWSKAIYAYAKAVTLYEIGKDLPKATEIMSTVTDLMQRIAGKSIPLEKFVAKKARKFIQQGNHLVLPGLELIYVFNCIGLAPRFVLLDVHLDRVSAVLAELHKVKDPTAYGNSDDEYWDDYCLAHLLRAIVLRCIAHPDKYAVVRPAKSPIPTKEADEQAQISLNNVLEHGDKIKHDHYLAWFAHYELAKLHGARGEYAKAKLEYQIVMSGKIPEVNGKSKGKVSMQNMAVLRSNAALLVLQEEGRC